jgi:two-component system response regulator PilR (NtrC family)
MKSGRTLVVDDERSIREFLSILLEQEGHQVTTADSVESGLACLADERFDLVICDLKLPDGTGLNVLEEARRRSLECEFIIITAHTTPQHAMESMRAGAAEYLSKPFNVDDLKTIINKLLARRVGEADTFEVPEFVGKSEPISRILRLVPRVAATPSSILITGESGTGKELLARAIHAASPKAEGPFLTVNCGAIPEGLLESELFGHTRGSFTGAVRDHIGLFAQAEGGSIFLDEVGELPLQTQVKLLRVLQEHRVRPVGGEAELAVTARVLAATNRDLHREVRDGRFREDLYYRLNVIHLHLPPLRERTEDIPELARHFIARTCKRFGIDEMRLTTDACHVLQAYGWPGNVRELLNVIERSVALESTGIISSGSLPEHLRGSPITSSYEQASLPEEGIDLEEFLNNQRRALMRQALSRTAGHQKRAAELLRMSYRAFRYHADKLGLTYEEESK